MTLVADCDQVPGILVDTEWSGLHHETFPTYLKQVKTDTTVIFDCEGDKDKMEILVMTNYFS